jgi:two-component system, OmpR family, sensor histidine kinase CssS
MVKPKLTEQLLLICILIVTIIIFSLGVILPNNLIPIYETNVYNYLRQPLSFVETADDISGSSINAEIAYIYISKDYNDIKVSDNLKTIMNNKTLNKFLNSIDYNTGYGKFKYQHNTYYYVTANILEQNVIALTNDDYINTMRHDILKSIFVIVGFTFALVSLILILWANNLVNRIKKIKDNIDNINNDNYVVKTSYNYDDELCTLDTAVQNMRTYLKEKEEYKNQMYQNISHDFKTPITVMKSYMEAYRDGVESESKAMEVMSEQLNKLEIKVHSLLYLNKLNYFQDKKDNLNEQYDVSKIVYAAVDKFKVSRPDVEFVLDIDKKDTIYRGSADMWEAIIDNILNNFMRYAKKKVKITVKNKKIVLYNDGENIDENVLNNIFTPYEKGVKGVFGLGLSIVKKTLHFLDYDISIENVKNGVKFTIFERR